MPKEAQKPVVQPWQLLVLSVDVGIQAFNILDGEAALSLILKVLVILNGGI